MQIHQIPITTMERQSLAPVVDAVLKGTQGDYGTWNISDTNERAKVELGIVAEWAFAKFCGWDIPRFLAWNGRSNKSYDFVSSRGKTIDVKASSTYNSDRDIKVPGKLVCDIYVAACSVDNRLETIYLMGYAKKDDSRWYTAPSKKTGVRNNMFKHKATKTLEPLELQ